MRCVKKGAKKDEKARAQIVTKGKVAKRFDHIKKVMQGR